MRIVSAKGFTLVEVLVALAIFSIAFTGFVSLLTSVLHANAQAKRRTEAATFAQDKLEELRQSATPTAGSDSITPTGGSPYSRTWTVGAGPTAALRTVTVTVTWTDYYAQTVQLSTIVKIL